MITCSKCTLSLSNLKISRPKVRKNLTNFCKKFCESSPWCPNICFDLLIDFFISYKLKSNVSSIIFCQYLLSLLQVFVIFLQIPFEILKMFCFFEKLSTVLTKKTFLLIFSLNTQMTAIFAFCYSSMKIKGLILYNFFPLYKWKWNRSKSNLRGSRKCKCILVM